MATPVLTAPSRSLARQLGAYVLFVGVPLLLLMATMRYGARLPAPLGASAATRPSGAAASAFDLGSLILQLLVIVGAARLCGAGVARLGQPRVVGEMLAGILLGPSVLGSLAPTLSLSLFPAGASRCSRPWRRSACCSSCSSSASISTSGSFVGVDGSR
jgi:hypothetical protein